jgi:hypothetical protein
MAGEEIEVGQVRGEVNKASRGRRSRQAGEGPVEFEAGRGKGLGRAGGRYRGM